MVEGLVQVIARLARFESLPQDPSQQVETVAREMTARLSNGPVTKRILLSHLQSVDCFLVEVT